MKSQVVIPGGFNLFCVYFICFTYKRCFNYKPYRIILKVIMQISSPFGRRQLIPALKKHIDENGLATRLQFQKSRVNIDPLKPKYQVCLIVIYVVVLSFIQTIPPRRRPNCFK